MDVRPRLDPEARFGLRFTMIVVALVLLVAPFGFLLAEVLAKGPITRFDQRVANHANSYALRTPGAVTAAKVASALGSTRVLFALVGLVAVYFLLRRRQPRPAIFLVATAIAGSVLNRVLKVTVGRSRPHFAHAVSTEFGKSFPSGHAMNSAVVYGAIVMLVWLRFRDRRVRICTVVAGATLVCAIAASRVVLGVHYVSDVVAGVVLGTAFVLASGAAFRFWRTANEGKPLESGPLPVERTASAVTEDA